MNCRKSFASNKAGRWPQDFTCSREKAPEIIQCSRKQFYHCFGCGKSGDVFKFIEDYRGVSFMDAVKIIAGRARIPLEVENGRKEQQTKHILIKHFMIFMRSCKVYHAV